MARTKSNGAKDTSAKLGFGAKLWLAPYKGRIYDHTCRSGGMFVQVEKFVESNGGTAMRDSAKPISEGSLREFCGAKRHRGHISIYGQESNATTSEIAARGHVLTPGRYIGAEEIEDDGGAFEEKMPRLVAELCAQFAEFAKLEAAMRANLKSLTSRHESESQRPLEATFSKLRPCLCPVAGRAGKRP